MAENVLLIGGGGREHAIARAIKSGADAVEETISLYVCAENRNPGIADLSDGFELLDTVDTEAVTEYADSIEATMTIVGPEAPLEAGVVDALEAKERFVFGPPASLARIETDKAFQREFMEDHDIPGCPEYEVFDDPEEACAYLEEHDDEFAIKPTGLTGGKGVKVMGEHLNREEATEYISEGEYDSFVLEERLEGEEFTIQAFVNRDELRVTPAVQDHKRADLGDTGPNTGGMGSFSAPGLTLPFMTEDDYHEAVDILQQTVDALGAYRGILYGQFMLTADGIKVVEFNARFGDPEAMNTLPVMNTSLVDLMLAARNGESLSQLSFAPYATVCIYAVPEGYPTDPNDGVKIEIPEDELDNALFFYASVDEQDDGIYTTTSRAFAVVGIAETINEAKSAATEALNDVLVDGVEHRYDIGSTSVIQSRIDHMKQLRPEIELPDWEN